ncbi:dienelactone hydrolase family protein [Nocardioides anomalus]|uniref:Dienelactone hydrolase family protein n=2 Tax=Nocardioides anomalus TaxID=2712223 RepID=A0A6G6WLM4_9ACTN|nr:dienelactone hydrolase family protein [Nocardioides anomalus]
MPARLWLPESGSGPGVLLLQEIFGVSAYIQRRGADLAAAGYVVLAPELYWRLDEPPLDETAPDVVDAAMARAGRLDPDTTVADAVAALGALRARSEVTGPVGALGFCFGGGLAFNVAAVAPVDFLVSYYGSGLPGLLDLAPQVTVPSLHHFGTADDYIDAESVERVRAAVTAHADVSFELYEGANHAFDNDDFYFFHPEASALAWDRTLAFLAEHASR